MRPIDADALIDRLEKDAAQMEDPIAIMFTHGAINEIKHEPTITSEAYSKAVFTWLMDYQIRAAELKGRYTPYEVLSWVANDWRKEHEGFDR